MNAARTEMGTSTATTDRRRDARYEFIAEAEIIDVASGTAVTARTVDLSRGGCYIDIFSPLPEKTVVTLRLTKWQQTLKARAQVAYSSMGMGMGLMFDVLDPMDRATLESWLTQVRATQAC